MNVDTTVLTALAERVDQLDRQMQALSSSLSAAYQAAGRPEIGTEVDAVMRARRRARLQLLQGGRP